MKQLLEISPRNVNIKTQICFDRYGADNQYVLLEFSGYEKGSKGRKLWKQTKECVSVEFTKEQIQEFINALQYQLNTTP